LRSFILLMLLWGATAASVLALDSSPNDLDEIEKQIEAGSVSDQIAQRLEKLVESDPKSSRARLLMGECLESMGLRDQALDQLKSAVALGSDYPKAYVGLVKEYVRLGKFPQAKAVLDQAKKRFPQDYEIDFWLGNFYQSRGMDTEAMAQYMEAIKSEKPIIGLASAIGRLKLKQHRAFEAVLYANLDLKVKPDFLMANEIKGLALYSVGRYKEALAPLAIAYRANPYNLDVAFAYAQCLYWKGDYKNALPPALVHLAFGARLSADDPKSKRLITDIISHMPSENQIAEVIVTTGLTFPINKMPAYHFGLGDVLDRSGFHKLAMKEYDLGLKLKPDFGRAWFRLGLDYESFENNYQAALECYNNALKFRPNDKEISAQQARLDDRLANRKHDLAWQLKDKLRSLANRK
jgi:tetratricopeptide (TPR) repeat protein